jgi:hypothetical protein
MAKAMSGMFFSWKPNQIPYVFPACNRFWSDKQFQSAAPDSTVWAIKTHHGAGGETK